MLFNSLKEHFKTNGEQEENKSEFIEVKYPPRELWDPLRGFTFSYQNATFSFYFPEG